MLNIRINTQVSIALERVGVFSSLEDLTPTELGNLHSGVNHNSFLKLFMPQK